MEQAVNQVIESLRGYVPALVGAVGILVIGWLVALVLSSAVRGVIKRLQATRMVSGWARESADTKPPDLSRAVGKGVFWLVMILVLVAFFQVLGLTLATDPLNQFLNEVFQFAPKVIGAGLLLLLAWILAGLLRMLVKRVLTAINLDERFGSSNALGTAVEGAPQKVAFPITKTLSDIVYWVILLLFLPAILGALDLEGLLAPVQNLVNDLLAFLPNLLGAALIGLVGWFIARVVQRIVTNLMTASGADKLSNKLGIVSASKVVGLVVYVVILIPVLIAALNTLRLTAITRPASDMLTLFLEAFPSIFAAGIVLVIAYVVGRLVATFVSEMLAGMGFNSLPARLGIGREPEEGQRTLAEIAGYLVLVTIMLFAILEASSLLGFAGLSGMTEELMIFGAHILVGLVILAFGLYVASLVAKAIEASSMPQTRVISAAARIGILVLAGAMALSQMGLADEIISLAFGLTLGAVALAIAIAFGVGGREIAARKLDEWAGKGRSENR